MDNTAIIIVSLAIMFIFAAVAIVALFILAAVADEMRKLRKSNNKNQK